MAPLRLGSLLAAAAVAAVGAAEDGTCSAGAGCAPPAPAPFTPTKGNNLNHSGASSFTGPFDLSKPLWIWEEPNRVAKGNQENPFSKVFHASPMLDGEFNTYIVSTTGWVYSIDKAGATRWEFPTTRQAPGNLALYNGTAYTIDTGGVAFAIDMRTGKELWRNQVAKSAPADTHSLVAHEGLVIMACNPSAHDLGWGRDAATMNEAVCALDAKDGHVRWIFDQVNYTKRGDAITCNQVHAIAGDSVLFADNFGGVYSVALADGMPRWHSKAVTDLGALAASQGMLPYGTTATMVVGPNDMAYHAFNRFKDHGVVRAHSVHDGAVKWEKEFSGTEVNASPGVGKLFGWLNKLAVVVALGVNPMPVPQGHWHSLMFALGIRGAKTPVVALDAQTGQTLWTFDVSYSGECAGSFYKADGEGNLCLPDVWGNPSIGADGTVYLNYSGGKAFAIRDANSDGIIDPKDPAEVSAYHHGFGSNGATALGPGFAVAPNCRQMVAWSS